MTEHFVGEELGVGRPTCPACGSPNGVLGTSYAYFICHEPGCAGSVYWLGDGRHPSAQGKTWQDAIDASPWGKARWEKEHP